MRLRHSSTPPELKATQKELERIAKEKEAAVNDQDYERAQELRDAESAAKARVDQLRSDWQAALAAETPEVTEEDIAQVVALWTGIPVTRIAQEESERLLQMEDALHKRVIGQQEAIDTVSRAVRRARAGLKDPKRPIGSFIFLGPTGVGKTELAKALAEFMFGSEDALIKIDMSEFMERHNVSRLVGAPPGYVGFEEGGQLTEAVRRKTYSVVLLDEIEKAHPEVFNMLLQILEDGHLTDAKGRRVDFRNTVIIMTSNVGAKELLKDTSLGFRPVSATEDREREAQYDRMKDKVLEQLKTTFRPEFLNRVDSQVVFRSLTVEEIREIVDLLLARVRDAAEGAADRPRGQPGGQGPHHQARLRRRLRRPAAAPRHPEHDRGPARRGAPGGSLHGRRHDRRGPLGGRRPDHRTARGEDARRGRLGRVARARRPAAYVCQACAAAFPRWEGQCRACGAWNSLVETLVRPPTGRRAASAGPPAGPVRSSRCPWPRFEVAGRPPRRSTGIGEVDRVLGGGLVPGSLLLLAGEPGIGKSTLVLQVAAGVARRTGRERAPGAHATPAPTSSTPAPRNRRRSSTCAPPAWASPTARPGAALAVLAEHRRGGHHRGGRRHCGRRSWWSTPSRRSPLDDLDGPARLGRPGAGVGRPAGRLRARRRACPSCSSGHVTKDGSLAGPRTLEHLVDAVLMLEGDRYGVAAPPARPEEPPRLDRGGRRPGDDGQRAARGAGRGGRLPGRRARGARVWRWRPSWRAAGRSWWRSRRSWRRPASGRPGARCPASTSTGSCCSSPCSGAVAAST